MQFIDTHIHLTMPDYASDYAGVFDRAATAGVTHYVCPGIDLASSRQAIALHRDFPQVIPAVGLHPESPDEDLHAFAALAAQSEVKAIGEIGTDRNGGEWSQQEARFRWFLDLAVQLNKPALIHVRETWDETFKILAEYPELKGKAVIHCFTGGPEEARRLSELGLLLSLTGIIGRKNMEATHEVIKTWPLDQMMLETDGPWLSWPGDPWPNEPTTVLKVAQKVADLKGVSIEAVAGQTTATARRFFSLA